jgi:hypothetical protein
MPLVLKQARAVVDNRTTMVCLHISGAITSVDLPFETLAGDFMEPPFHVHCRTIVSPWVPGMVNDLAKEANAEMLRRPKKDRRIGPDGEIGGKVPPPSDTNPPTGFSFPGATKSKYQKGDPKPATGPDEIRVRGIEEELGHPPGYLDTPENVRRVIDDINELLEEDDYPKLEVDRDLLIRWLTTPTREEPLATVVERELFAAKAKRLRDSLLEIVKAAVKPKGSSQERGLSEYLFNSFDLNGRLRDGTELDMLQQMNVKGLDALIAAQKALTEDVVVWRGMGLSQHALDTWDGREVTDPAYLSTAPLPEQAEMFARKGKDDTGEGLLVEIIVPAGSRGISPHFAMLDDPEEYGLDEDATPMQAATQANELILPRGTTLRFTGEPEPFTMADGTVVKKVRAVVVNA